MANFQIWISWLDDKINAVEAGSTCSLGFTTATVKSYRELDYMIRVSLFSARAVKRECAVHDVALKLIQKLKDKSPAAVWISQCNSFRIIVARGDFDPGPDSLDFNELNKSIYTVY